MHDAMTSNTPIPAPAFWSRVARTGRPSDALRVLGISGSLRKASINSTLLRVARQLAPAGLELSVFATVAQLPLFNPDLESSLPPEVLALHAAVANADALLIASPEYAHGVTGVIKNTLDWLVSFESFTGISVAVLNASARAHHADEALRETLRTMSAIIIESASLCIPLLGAKLDEDGMLGNPEVCTMIRRSLTELHLAVTQGVAIQEGPVSTLP